MPVLQTGGKSEIHTFRNNERRDCIMRRSIWERIQEIINKHVIHGKWVRSVIALSCVVIFITTYVLVMPAVTLSGTPDCGQEEHRHTDDCYETQSEQICGLEEHTHSDDCYDEDGNLICGLEEHVHNDGCYETEEVLTCGMEEHIHTSDCYNGADAEEADSEDSSSSAGDAGEVESKTEQGEDVTDEVNSEDAETVASPEATEAADPEGPAESEEPASGSLQAEGEDYTITVSYTEEANLPADVSLKVEEITNNEEYDSYKSQVEEEILDPESKKVTAARFFDITLLDSEGNELHPEKAVTVVIETKDTLNENEELQVCHFDQEQEKPVKVKSQEIINETYEEDNLGVQFEAETFYVYGIVRTKPIGTTVLTADGETYTVTVSYTEEANLPADVSLKVEEITNTEEYEGYKSQVEEEILDPESKKVTAARFFDITLMDSEGNELHPEKAVTVVIETKDTWKENEEVQVCHFDQEKDKPVIVESQEITNKTYKEDNLGVQFEAESFSVYGIVGTETITGGLVSADGSTYEVNVTYGSEAGIPKGSTLKLVEYAEGSLEYQQAKNKVDEYREEEANAQEEEMDAAEEDEKNTGFSALGISILDPYGNEIEPKGEVSVVITMKTLPEGFEAEDLLATMEVHHLAETDGAITVEKVAAPVLEGSKITANDNGAAAEFVTNSFSTYTVRWGNLNTTTLHFVDENGQELTGVKLTSSGTTIDGASIDLSDLLIDDTTMDLRNAFTVDGKTLSNTHIGSYQNLSNNNDRQIVANEIRRDNNNFLYRTFNEGSDYAGSTWSTIPYNSNLYLVYSDVPTGSGGGGGTPDDPDAPDFGEIGNSKTITDNKNGTYTLNLSVTGQAQTASENNHVNVAIVLDTSSSMVKQGTGTRLQDAKRALVGTTQDEIEASVAHKLLSNNTTDDPNIVELAFITFDGQSHDHPFGNSNWTTNEDSFRTTVNGVGTASGTNWEDAMRAVGNLGGDDDPTYVIFITDGQPSRYWRGNTPDVYVEGEGSTLAANDEARALIRDKGVEIYGIFGWGDQKFYEKDLLGQLIDYAYNKDGKRNTHRFNASGTEDVIEVLESILNTINLRFGFADVEINDGMTGLTSTEVARATVQAESFNYTITYVDAADNSTHTVNCTKNSDGTISIPSVTYNVKDPEHPGQYKSKTTEAVTITGASYANGRVQWHLEKVGSTDPYILEEAWTYKVSFVVWPSQHSYDLVAALNNDPTLWGKDYTFVDNGETITSAQYQNQITGGPDGPFSLKTNTDASVSYKEVTAKTTDEGTTYTYSDPKTVTIPYNDVMKLTSEEMTVEKLWYNPLDSRPVESQIELSVTLDGEEFLSHLVLHRDNDYKHNAFISS